MPTCAPPENCFSDNGSRLTGACQGATHAEAKIVGSDFVSVSASAVRHEERSEPGTGLEKGACRPDDLLSMEVTPGRSSRRRRGARQEREAENKRLKLLVAELAMDRRMLQEALKKKL